MYAQGKCERREAILLQVSLLREKNVGVARARAYKRRVIKRHIESNIALFCRTDTDWGQHRNDALSSDCSIFRTGDPSSV